ncbi:helix-turn-helix domain-containing protein [Mucilaginibacter flavus]|uniref:helix-turn-helix domain-containing protein n=1 Tax=Mucilaginibacter flavus TaxID=931504 RepID=UPI0025B55C98|nr:AraC family transcriptional regulator [Mucilaginibacter flavus]MDN3583977.1 AraC family transcriptional regulator [Mucilaginibacter flavus]
MVLHIKNMVCDRCQMIVRQQLENLGFTVKQVALGSAEITSEPDEEQMQLISAALKVPGFELINKETDKTVEAIKNAVIELVHHTDLSELNISFSDLIAKRVGKDYAHLSRLFSNAQDTTIERFIIEQKVEKIKELMEYGELNLNEISYQMGYSSSAHLSTQFKSITGLTPSGFKSSGKATRKPIDKI